MSRPADLAPGALPVDSPWQSALAVVPRHAFLPHAYIRSTTGWQRLDASGSAERERLRRLATTDVTVVVQLDGAGKPVASCLQPSMAARILNAASVEDGHHVLELGTGTGYLTALLCERLTDAQVVTVEIDPELAALAGGLLAARGYRPRLVVTDGDAGCPAQAPYHRVIATYAVPRIPAAWVEQTRPGGVIVTPLRGGVARLVVTGEGSASGRFLPQPAAILPSRSPTLDAPAVPPLLTPPPASAAGLGRLPSHAMFDNDFRFFLNLVTPGLQPPDGHDPGAVELHADDGSLARVSIEGVVEAGPRQLWKEAERAHAEWCELGQPAPDRFRLTVAGEAQTVWVDGTADRRCWPLVRTSTSPVSSHTAG